MLKIIMIWVIWVERAVSPRKREEKNVCGRERASNICRLGCLLENREHRDEGVGDD